MFIQVKMVDESLKPDFLYFTKLSSTCILLWYYVSICC